MPSIDQPTRNLVPDSEAARMEKLSSWQMTKLSWREMLSLYAPVLKRTFGWIILLQAIQVLGSQFSADAMDSIRISGREDLTSIALIAISELVFTLVWSALWIAVISIAANRIQSGVEERPVDFAKTLNQILIEQTRVLAAVIWRIPLIIPAGIQWVRLAFVPFVVLFDQPYQTGKRDALNQSRVLSYRHFWLLNWYLLIASAATWIVESLISADGSGLWDSPLRSSVAGVINAAVGLASGLFLYSLYRKLSQTDVTE